MNFKYLTIIAIFLFACSNAESQRKNKSNNFTTINKVNGVSFVAPSRAIDSSWTVSLQSVNANWVAIIPYAFSRQNEASVNYDGNRQYWGESLSGVRTNIQQAHQAGLKVMIKPQVWMSRNWIGDFDLSTEEEWKVWEASYTTYIMQFVKIAIEEKAEMICIGTEYRNAVKKRPDFWTKLANDIKAVYNGKLTYCANWDDYQTVIFWKSLDFVGLSGYFPLTESKTPTVNELLQKWKPIKDSLKKFSNQTGKPILFTEYGYRSMDQAAWKSWEMEYQERQINFEAQANAYEALYLALWDENWFAGGFAWKWYSSFRRMDHTNNHDWTPQNKKAQEVMKQYYAR